jgi:hypothetical protein
VSSNGGTIENGALEGLYDPVIAEAKSAGWYSDLLFFGAASAVENVSGSVATIFDASGDQNDGTQDASASRPTIQSSGIGSRQSASFDGSDDYMVLNNISDVFDGEGKPFTFLMVLESQDRSGWVFSVSNSDDTSNALLGLNYQNDQHRFFIRSDTDLKSTFSTLFGTTKTKTALAVRSNGIDRSLYEDEQLEDTGSKGQGNITSDLVTLGSLRRSKIEGFSNFTLGSFLVFEDDIGDQKTKDLSAILGSYYSL